MKDDGLERFILLGIRLFKLCLLWALIALAVGVAVVAIWPPARPELGSTWLPLPGLTRIRFGLGLVWRTENGPIGIGLGTAWWNLPGTIIGFLVGFYVSGKAWFDDGKD